MAIDFGRLVQGVATGAMGQFNAEVAAKDKMKGEMIQRVGINFLENTLPEFQKKEKIRKETYDKLVGRFDINVAEYMGQNGFITGDPNDYKNILVQLGDNPDIKADKLKQYLEATDSSYTKRAQGRFDAIKEREKTIMGLTTGDSKIGDMTAKLQIPESTPMTETTEEVVTPAVPGSQVGPQVTEAVPEKTETKEVPLPSYEDIFGDGTEKRETVFFSMDREDQTAYQKLSDAQFKADTLNEVSGMRSIQEAYKTDYNNLDDKEKGKLTLNQYSRERYFREVFLPSKGLSFRTEPADIIKARELINYYNSQGEDTMVEEIRNRLRSKGYNLTDYLL